LDANIRSSAVDEEHIRCWERIRILLGWVEACLGAESWGDELLEALGGCWCGLRFLFLLSGWLGEASLVEGL